MTSARTAGKLTPARFVARQMSLLLKGDNSVATGGAGGHGRWVPRRNCHRGIQVATLHDVERCHVPLPQVHNWSQRSAHFECAGDGDGCRMAGVCAWRRLPRRPGRVCQLAAPFRSARAVHALSTSQPRRHRHYCRNFPCAACPAGRFARSLPVPGTSPCQTNTGRAQLLAVGT